MTDTKKFKAQIAKNNVKSTKITVIGSIIVALIGFLGMIYVNSKTDDNKESHEQLVQELMKQLNTLVIPQIQKELQEINVTLKELSQDESAARERIARLEGIIEALPRSFRHRTRPTKIITTNIPDVFTKAIKKIKDETPIKLPMLQVQQKLEDD